MEIVKAYKKILENSMFKTLIMQIDINGSNEGCYRDCIPGLNNMCLELEKQNITLIESECDK